MPGHSDISKPVSVRLRNDTAEWIKKHDGRKIIEAVYDLYEKGQVYLDGSEVCVSRVRRFGNEFEDDGEAARKISLLNKQIAELRENLIESHKEIASLKADAIDGELMGELESMGKPYGITAKGLIREFVLMLGEGRVGLSAEGLSVGTVDECPFDWRMFTNACDEMSYDYNEAMKKLIPMLFRV